MAIHPQFVKKKSLKSFWSSKIWQPVPFSLTAARRIYALFVVKSISVPKSGGGGHHFYNDIISLGWCFLISIKRKFDTLQTSPLFWQYYEFESTWSHYPSFILLLILLGKGSKKVCFCRKDYPWCALDHMGSGRSLENNFLAPFQEVHFWSIKGF